MDDELRTTSDNVIRMLREAVPEIYRELNGAVRDVARAGADLAKAEAAGEDFTPPGKSHRGKGSLIEDIGYSSRNAVGYIRETATRDGYTYPGVFEFSREYKGGKMRRPFLIPARDKLIPYAHDRIDEAVKDALEKVQS